MNGHDIDPLLLKHAAELRETWQGKVLFTAKEKTGAVVLSMLAHTYPDQIDLLCRVVFPGFKGFAKPFLTTCGKIARSGKIYATVWTDQGLENWILYKNEVELTEYLRRLADNTNLSDAERVQFFLVAKKWIVCDFRVGPNGEDLST